MEVATNELSVDDEPDAVPRARVFAAGLLRAWDAADLVDDGQLVVTELVTNAVLHAGCPARLRLVPLLGGVRVEVADHSRVAPLPSRPSDETMTGRGLALVAALSRRWGVDQVAEGKVVWCELMHADGSGAPSASPPAQVMEELWADDVDVDQGFLVEVGDVPTDLLLAAKAHVDNLVREFTLASRGAATGDTAPVPVQLAQLIEAVVHGFAQARNAIKRQAVRAAARGEPRTTLTLRLPLSAAKAGEEYLAAIDAVDDYARAARLLTLESPPQHRVFRQWYVQTIVAKLRQAAAGEPQPITRTLEQLALDQLDTLTAAQRATERAARLQAVTAALASASTVEQVAAAVVLQGVSALGASAGTLVMERDGHLVIPGALGYSDPVISRLRDETLGADLPAATAIRSGEPVWLENAATRDSLFPKLVSMEPGTTALCAVPVKLGERVLGALRFSFDRSQFFDEDEQGFVLALAAQTAAALDRSAVIAAERAARADAEALASRLAQLQQATAELTAVHTVEDVAEIVVSRAAQALGATLSTLSVLEPDGSMLRMLRMQGGRESSRRRWSSFPVAANLPASEAVRENRPVVVRGTAELEHRYPSLVGQAVADQPLICLPLSVGRRRVGVISLSFPPGTSIEGGSFQQFLMTLADASAQAIAGVLAQQRAHAASRTLALVAEASAELARSLDYRTTLSNVAHLLVPDLADWCAVHVVEGRACQPLAVAHVDPAKLAQARRLQQRYPVDLDAGAGVATVIRTGAAEMYPHITDEMLAAGATDEDHLAEIRSLGLSSVIVVPMTGRSGTFGAITLGHAESGRHHTSADLAVAEDLGLRAAIAVENARAFSEQSGQLASITRVAEAAQHAILAPVPQRVGPVRLSAAYVSAARDALVGGDLYEVVPSGNAVRLLIADVRGKGLPAVRTATVVLGIFRSAAVDFEDLGEVARQMDERLRPYLLDEDFVTAIIAEIQADGSCVLAGCGHPPPLRASRGRIGEVALDSSPPLGLGAAPTPVSLRLEPGDRLLLYTDGLLEARDARGRFVDATRVLRSLAEGDIDTVLERSLEELRAATGPDLGDDLALLVAEYQPEQPGDRH